MNMMNRRSTRTRSAAQREAQAQAAAAAAATESRQPQQEDRRTRTIAAPSTPTNNVPRSPAGTHRAPSTPISGNVATPSNTTTTTPPPPSSFPRTRCYRLNLEKPFDIRQQKSPLGRDYSGPPIHESDLPPAQGPSEYLPPAHLCSKEEMAWRRHSWGGFIGSQSGLMTTTPSTPVSELMSNLHVSVSEESTNSSDPKSIAISTARIFRGIVVDGNGVITSMNSRAMKSARNAAKNGTGNDPRNKMGEKSRQAAKIDKAKDLIDEVVENGGTGSAMSDEENDPSKIVSLFVMGEYEELNDLVRDGSKKLRDSKSLSDDAILMYNRPRVFPGASGSQMSTVMSGGTVTSPTASGMASPLSQNHSAYNTPNGYGGPTPPSPAHSQAASPMANIRKRVFSADKSRSRYKQVPRSAPPKLKSNPRDSSSRRASSARSSSSSAAVNANSGVSSPTYHRGNSTTPVHGHNGPFGCVPMNTASVKNGQQHQQPTHNSFQQQCNFFPPNSDWTESLWNWNCGAHLSPTMSPQHSNPSSPRNPPQESGGFRSPTHAGNHPAYSSAAATPTSNSGYHHHHHQHGGSYHSGSGYHQAGSTSVNSGYNNGSTYSGHYRDEGRNPSYTGYGSRGGREAGVRDTVVM